MKVHNIRIKCPCCKGTGRVELSADMQRTLDGVSFDDWRSTQDIAARVADRFVKINAINNRLRSLERDNLIESQNRGRAIYWKRLPLALWRIVS